MGDDCGGDGGYDYGGGYSETYSAFGNGHTYGETTSAFGSSHDETSSAFSTGKSHSETTNPYGILNSSNENRSCQQAGNKDDSASGTSADDSGVGTIHDHTPSSGVTTDDANIDGSMGAKDDDVTAERKLANLGDADDLANADSDNNNEEENLSTRRDESEQRTRYPDANEQSLSSDLLECLFCCVIA